MLITKSVSIVMIRWHGKIKVYSFVKTPHSILAVFAAKIVRKTSPSKNMI